MHAWHTAIRRGITRFGMAAVCTGLALATTAARAATLDPVVLPQIEAATFEVVEAKPASDPLSYERALPLDLLPYQERTDKYHSIGTAFAIGDGRYVTAGHVLMAGLGSLWGPPALRDAAGHVYAIDKIEKFALRKDFVVFTLTSQPGTAALAINPKPVPNTAVYAVGNALGTGVVIRDGLYTSDTPEQQDGAWKWLRFSAAASPGNSGGPLLDQDGKVIGVVLMKSANENLNYALPIADVLGAPAGRAEIDRRVPYQFDLFDTTLTNSFKAEFKLPLTLAAFYAKFAALEDSYVDDQLKALLAKEAMRTFPQGSGSDRLLYATPDVLEFPALASRTPTGDWALAAARGPQIPLDDNGYIAIGLAGRNLLFHLRKPDQLTAAQLYHDPRWLMDRLLKLGFMQRTVATEKVRVTSLGQPATDTVYTDRWQRPWQVRVWPVPYANLKVILLALSVPDGYVGIVRDLPASREHDFLINLEAMTDFFQTGYEGTLAQWQGFLAEPKLLPAAFRGIHLDVADGKRLTYASPSMRLTLTSALVPIAPATRLALGFNFFPSGKQVVWAVNDVRVTTPKEAANTSTLAVQRFARPPAALGEDFQTAWHKVSTQARPYDGKPRNENDISKIDAVLDAGSTAPDVRHTVFYGVEGSHPDADMQAKLDALRKAVELVK